MSLTANIEPPRQLKKTHLVAVAGNPNCGKTTIFNALTGLRHKVGNYPGVTVEKREGIMIGDPSIRLLDLPGTYSLTAHSPDEAVARDVIFGGMSHIGAPDAVLIVLDAGNLERNLYLATQIIDLGLRVVVACNMMDVVQRAGHRLDTDYLSKKLGVPVIPTVGARGTGIPELVRAIQDSCHRPYPQLSRQWQAAAFIEDEIAAIRQAISSCHEQPGPGNGTLSADGLAVSYLSNGSIHRGHERKAPYNSRVAQAVAASVQRLTDEQGIDPTRELTVARYAWIGQWVNECLQKSDRHASPLADRLDRVLTHRVSGLLIFAPTMALLFFSIFVVAGPMMDTIENLMSWVSGAVVATMPEGLLRDLLVDGVLAGVGNVLVFFPQICILFLFIALLEDSGYMSRAAFLMNRIMSRVGLHGKSFIPLLSSHACAVPGIMATRTIENPRDRLVTILVAPLMGCSARLPVYTLLIAACLPVSAWMKAATLLAMYGLGVSSALLMATLFKKTLLRGPAPAFVIELPPYRWPQVGNVLCVMWDRARLFLFQAGTIILAMTIVLWALMNFPKDAGKTAWYETQRSALQATAVAQGPDAPELEAALGELDQREAADQLEYSLVGRFGQVIAPILEPLGFDWKIGVAIIASVAAREVFVGTMGVIYSVGDADAESKSLRQELAAARWPDGRRVFTPLVAVGLMVFYVLACQCVSTLAVVRRETASWRWPLFMFAYMSALAYVAALLVYQVGSAFGIGAS